MEYFFRDRPFYNFNEMIEQYKVYIANCCYCISNVKELDVLSNDLISSLKIRDIAYRAKGEIESQVFIQNNNVGNLKKYIGQEIADIAEKIDNLINNNKLDHAEKMPSYVLFFDAIQAFWDFYNWFYSLISPSYGESSTFKNKSNSISAPVIALFCSLLNETKVIKKEYEEPIANYCQRVCVEYKLTYSDRVRQCFNSIGTKKNKQKVKELILPLIDGETAKILVDHLNNIK